MANRAGRRTSPVDECEPKCPNVGGTYSVEFWFWNGLPNDAATRDRILILSRSKPATTRRGATTSASAVRELRRDGCSSSTAIILTKMLEGRTTIEPKSWNHVVLVRDGEKVRVHLNGQAEPEIDRRCDRRSALGKQRMVLRRPERQLLQS